jgi:hypothetical protein
MAPVVFRLAKPQDYPAILRLQSANFIENLSPEEEGFLSAEFTSRQVAEIAEDLGTTVASVDGAMVAFLWAYRRGFDYGSPVIAKMLESYDGAEFEGQPLSAYKSYIYGPVCIDRAYRGRELLRGLYEAQNRHLRGVLKSAWLSFPATIPILSRLT